MADDAGLTSSAMKCAVCGRAGSLKKCAKCKVTYYCGREHQAKDWKIHKGRCADLAAANLADKEKQDRLPDAAEACSQSQSSDGRRPQKQDLITGEAIPFDTRPFKTMEFSQPSSPGLENLPQFVATQLKTRGFCVVDGALTEEKCERVLAEVKEMEEKGIMKCGQLAGGTTSARDEDKVVNADIRSDKLVWLEGDEAEYPAISGLIVDIMDYIVAHSVAFLDGKYTVSGRTKAMATCYPGSDTAYHRHVDNPNKDGRCITCICYLNKDWDSKRDGGFMRAFPSSLAEGDFIDVAPLMNRMLFFWSDSRTPHEVHPAKKERYAVTVWYFDHEERENAKVRSVNEDLSRIRGDVAIWDVEKKKVEKAMLEQQIENQATKAISLLSQEEIESISAFVQGHPDPRSALTKLGIAPSILDLLMDQLKLC